MKNYLLLILLLACTTSIAQSLPGSPTPTAPLCLTITQRQRLADSLATLPVVRQSAREFRTAADIARRNATGYSDALVAQQLRTTEASASATKWKGRARRRGLINWIYTALAAGAVTYFINK